MVNDKTISTQKQEIRRLQQYLTRQMQTTLNVRVLAFILAFPHATYSDFLRHTAHHHTQADYDMHKAFAANLKIETSYYLKGETKNK